ncbi:large ribosomal subunit protein uL29m-like [Corticium candelabrum]|uniref:large ribosomal subunit protein uL29m-like n=1 Tax=Corticium candelabrum TaxID=121492 RepID=UPI002E25FBD0|nr:large ribosomal subunit protein uL29m-like [Corticium candelabrum]
MSLLIRQLRLELKTLCGRLVTSWHFRPISMSLPLSDLSEFFPNENNEEQAKTGRSWRASEMRSKSNEDLHKLWYVLLKERNMLLTLKHEARRQGELTPSPERMRKVRKSMARIKVVLGERDRAVRDIRKTERRTDLQ